jgi:predicted permease
LNRRRLIVVYRHHGACLIFRDLFLRLRALAVPRRVERELDDELAFHIERETQKHVAAGLNPAAARARALARFGPVPLAADQCRDARGVSFVDDLLRDVVYAFRTYRRAPLAALTVVATVALGLGLVAVVFTIYCFFVLRVDAVRNPHELFAVTLSRPAGPGAGDEGVVVSRSDYEAMRSETGVFSDVVAMLDGGTPLIDGRLARPVLVSGNFFQALGVQAALGRPLLPEDDRRFEGRPAVVLSHIGWRKLFEGDPSVIGRSVTIAGAPHEIVGVMPEQFRGLAVTPPDYWLPLALAGQFHDDSSVREQGGFQIVGRLQSGVSREAAAAALSAWASGRAEFQIAGRRPVQAALSPGQGTVPGDGFAVIVAPLFFAFGLILMIGCANVANLLLARGVSRQREIGTRLSLGASRRRIVRQLLTESLILSLAAAACGVVVMRVFLDGALYAVISTLPPEIARLVSLLNVTAPAADWRLLLFMVAVAIASTVTFGLVPALQATRLDLVRTMRGEFTKDARPSRARHALIAVQVGASALLLICAAIFLRGALAAAGREPGVRTSDTVTVNIDNESKRDAVLQSLRGDAVVAAISASSKLPDGVVVATGASNRLPVDQMAVSSGYFDVLGLNVVNGRGFTQLERTPEAGVAIVSEAIARQLWPDGSDVGQSVRLETMSSSADARGEKIERALTVVGVVRDPGPGSAMSFRGVYLPTGPESQGTELVLRVRGNPEQARVALIERLPGLDPAFGVMALGSIFGMQTYVLQIGFWISVVLGGLALVLTVSGLFSVLSYVVEQQSKEIGVRMALGAATKHIAQLVLFQSLRPLGIGLIAGGGLAAAVAMVLMSTPLAAEIGDTIDVRDPVAYVASLLVIVTVCLFAVAVPALRAVRIDPIATLRKD